MASFKDLGLRDALLHTLEDDEIDRPTAIQESIIPPLRRGGNVIARASTGSGKTLAYTLGVLDRLEPVAAAADAEATPMLRALVLVPTREEAERVALQMTPYAQAAGLVVTAAGGRWGTSAAEADVLVAPVADAMEAVQGSALKLDAVEAVVIDGAAAIAALGRWESVDTLIDHLPRDAQRVLVSTVMTDEIQDLADRRIKRALHYPTEPALPGREKALEGTIGYVVVPEVDKVDVLARQLAALEGAGPPPIIFCRTDERAAGLSEQLSIRGFLVGEADDEEADVAVAAAGTTRQELLDELGEPLGQSLSFDVPADADTLRARHGGDPDSVVLVTPRELPHLKEIAAQALLGARPVPLPAERSAAMVQLAGFRGEVRRSLREEDVAAQLLVLEPLFQEFGAVEVAGALAALLRSRRPAEAPAAAATTPAAPARVVAAAEPASEPGRDVGRPPSTWTKLYVSVGSRDEVRPGDLVGALAGEANIDGSRIGKIDIRDNFSIVEVESAVAEQVIRAVNGTTIKGRSVRVDFDRGGDRGKRPAPPRRRTDRGGGERSGGPRGGAPRGGGGGAGGRGGPSRPPVRRPKE